jgi:hypothetical protein
VFVHFQRTQAGPHEWRREMWSVLGTVLAMNTILTILACYDAWLR